MKPEPDPAALQLAALEGEARTDLALTLLLPKTRRDTLRTTLVLLARTPRQEARPALRELYAHYARKGGVHDYGGYVRADIVRALRPVALPDDTALLLQACATYEFPPPGFVEEGALLRATGLVALADLDETLARLEAARLLVDTYTDANSGEPARTAVRTLATFGDQIALYQYAAATHGDSARADLTGECLRSLTQLPVALLPLLIQRYGANSAPAAHLGLFDLLLQHRQGPQHVEYLMDEIRRSPLEVARYLLLALVAAGDDALMTATVRTLGLVSDPARRAMAREALELVAGRSDVQLLLKSWQSRKPLRPER